MVFIVAFRYYTAYLYLKFGTFTKKVKESRYRLRNQNLLSLPTTKTNRFGTQYFLFRGSFLWNLHPDSVKNALSLASFKGHTNCYFPGLLPKRKFVCKRDNCDVF